MRILILAVVLVIGASGAAWARCADDFKELQARVERERHRQPPSPQAVAAAKELNKANQNMNNMDEIDCYNAVARARRLLTAPPPPEVKVEK